MRCYLLRPEDIPVLRDSVPCCPYEGILLTRVLTYTAAKPKTQKTLLALETHIQFKCRQKKI